MEESGKVLATKKAFTHNTEIVLLPDNDKKSKKFF
jgi:hypothetical protein